MPRVAVGVVAGGADWLSTGWPWRSCRPWPGRAWRPWPRRRGGRQRRRARRRRSWQLAAAPSSGCKQETGEQLHIGGLDLMAQNPAILQWRPVPKAHSMTTPPRKPAATYSPHGRRRRRRGRRTRPRRAGLAAHRPLPHQRAAARPPAAARAARDRLRRPLQRRQVDRINTLTQQKRLAFASKTPGRTQHINLFGSASRSVDDAVLADLPGYGYAAVPKRSQAALAARDGATT